MVSTDVGGEPILILGLKDVKTILSMLDRPETLDQDKVMKRIVEFVTDPACLVWESKQHDQA